MARSSPPTEGKSSSQQIDAIIKKPGDWRVEEVKWKKPSNPMGVPVWSHDGIICIGETLKSAARLIFPKGGHLKDPKRIFNTRLESNSVRAIDIHKGDRIDEVALEDLIGEAVALYIQGKG